MYRKLSTPLYIPTKSCDKLWMWMLK